MISSGRRTGTGRLLLRIIAAVFLFIPVLCPPRVQAASVKNTQKYYRVFVVGDSRTMYMKRHLKGKSKRVTFVYKNGGGLTWLKKRGYKQLVKAVKKYRKKAAMAGKPLAVVMNLGVNNLTMAGKYISYYKKIGKKLKKMGCTLFILSINPYDPKRAHACGFKLLPDNASSVNKFNKRLKAGTKKYYRWINSYSYLMRTGWKTGGGVRGGDGLHYMKDTSIKIYNFMIKAIDAAA